MLFGELRPLLRPMSRRLAAAGWVFAALGVAAGLAVAVGSGVRLSPAMQAVQATTTAATIAAALLLTLAAVSQPAPNRSAPAATGKTAPSNTDRDADTEDSVTGTHVRSFLVAAVAMLLGVVGFSLAGWLLPGGPSPQSTAFSQIFLLGAGSCGLTFLLLHKVAPSGADRNRQARGRGR